MYCINLPKKSSHCAAVVCSFFFYSNKPAKVFPPLSYTGPRFWKTSKRIRAVKRSDLKRGKNLASIDSSSDSDFDPRPLSKRTRTATVEDRLEKLEGDMQRANSGLLAESNERSELLKKLRKRFSELRQCFECLICKNSAKLPAIIAPCCNIVLGCESCVNQWLTTNPHCPHCRVNITMNECAKLPFIRNLEEALRDSSQSGAESSLNTSEAIVVD